MKEKNKSYFYNLIKNHHFSKDTMVKLGCIQLLDFLMTTDLDIESSFYFEDFRIHVNDILVDDEDFIYSVFYLCRKDIKVLQQEFSVFNHIQNTYNHYKDKNHILEMLKTQEFYNPISGNDLDKYQFKEEVLTFFIPTSFFLEKKFE